MRKASKILVHTAYESGRSELRETLQGSVEGDLVFLLGPSGVGKSEMAMDVMCDLAGDAKSWGVGRIPVIYTLAAPSHQNYFSPKDFIKRAYTEVNSPNLDWMQQRGAPKSKTLKQLESEIAQARILIPKPKNPTEGTYREGFAECIRERNVKYWFVDDTRALTMNRRSAAPPNHMLSYMSLAVEANIIICFIGTHAMASLIELNTEPRRRTTRIYVPRYHREIPLDRTRFFSLCVELGLPFSGLDQPLIKKMFEFIELATGGVYAEVVNLFKRSHRHCKRDKRTEICQGDLEASVYREAEYIALWKDLNAYDALQQPVSLKRMEELCSSYHESA